MSTVWCDLNENKKIKNDFPLVALFILLQLFTLGAVVAGVWLIGTQGQDLIFTVWIQIVHFVIQKKAHSDPSLFAAYLCLAHHGVLLWFLWRDGESVHWSESLYLKKQNNHCILNKRRHLRFKLNLRWEKSSISHQCHTVSEGRSGRMRSGSAT